MWLRMHYFASGRMARQLVFQFVLNVWQPKFMSQFCFAFDICELSHLFLILNASMCHFQMYCCVIIFIGR